MDCDMKIKQPVDDLPIFHIFRVDEEQLHSMIGDCVCYPKVISDEWCTVIVHSRMVQ
jgi:hypothetical protein